MYSFLFDPNMLRYDSAHPQRASLIVRSQLFEGKNGLNSEWSYCLAWLPVGSSREEPQVVHRLLNTNYGHGQLRIQHDLCEPIHEVQLDCRGQRPWLHQLRSCQLVGHSELLYALLDHLRHTYLHMLYQQLLLQELSRAWLYLPSLHEDDKEGLLEDPLGLRSLRRRVQLWVWRRHLIGSSGPWAAT